jgi:indoleacetamide hydrolase
MKSAIIALSIALLFAATSLAQDLTALSASEAAEKIRKGDITSEALTKALIDKVKTVPSLNAFITLDEAGALKAAKAADDARKANKSKGALFGVPLVIKDNIHVVGLPNTAGTPGMKDFVPRENAPVVEKLVAAGAIVLGKTNMHELAFGITSVM